MKALKEKKHTAMRQEDRAQVGEGGGLQSGHRVQEYVRKYDYP